MGATLSEQYRRHIQCVRGLSPRRRAESVSTRYHSHGRYCTPPVGFYTISTVFGESIAYSYAREHDMGCVCVRISTLICPETSSISHGDCLRVFEQTLVHLNVTFAVVFGVSDSNRPLYDLEHGRESIGYYPQDRSFVLEGRWIRLQQLEPEGEGYVTTNGQSNPGELNCDNTAMLRGFSAKLKFDPSQVEVVINDFEMVIDQGNAVLQCKRKSHLSFSGDIDRPQYVFSGGLDDMAAFNLVLSQAEIKEAMGVLIRCWP